MDAYFKHVIHGNLINAQVIMYTYVTTFFLHWTEPWYIKFEHNWQRATWTDPARKRKVHHIYIAAAKASHSGYFVGHNLNLC